MLPEVLIHHVCPSRAFGLFFGVSRLSVSIHGVPMQKAVGKKAMSVAVAQAEELCVV